MLSVTNTPIPKLPLEIFFRSPVTGFSKFNGTRQRKRNEYKFINHPTLIVLSNYGLLE